MKHEADHETEETARDPEFQNSANKRAGIVLIAIFAGAIALLISVELIRRM